MAIENLAQDYTGQPVLFLETKVDVNYTDPLYLRQGRWWDAFGGGSVTLPLVMVDSGHDISNGFEDFQTVYSAMVDASLARPPQAQLSAMVTRVGDGLHVEMDVTNTSGITLGWDNTATAWVIVYEVFDAPGTESLTSRYVRAVVDQAITTDLADGATATYNLDVPPLSGVVWDNLHAVVLVDYLPADSTGAFDMLQALQVDRDILSVGVDPFVLSMGANPGMITVAVEGAAPRSISVDLCVGSRSSVPICR